MSGQACDPSRLIEILDAPNVDECNETIVEHLEECKSCQRELERMAAGDWWRSVGKQLLAAVEIDPDDSGSQVIAICDESAVQSSSFKSWSVDLLEPPSHPELLGQLGKYQIESVIGQGGMGIVLKGFDTGLNRTVAIKVLAPHLASSGAARQRFSREARAAAAVVHDHVVAIHGIETDGELPYIVMPYIGGESLQSHVDRSGALDVKDIVRIAMQIASGLSAAHEQGLVHRDVKPANILLENGFGRVLITDFGLARAADDASITRSGLVAGTPHYMSPEQANGDVVDQRSDLFSLGSVIFFMATGRASFRGDGAMAVLNAICHKAPKSACDINSNVPKPLDAIIERLMKKSPDDRFGTAAEVRKLLAEYLAYLQNPSQNSLPVELSPVRRIKPGWVAGVATMICSLLLVVVFAAWPQSGNTTDEELPDTTSSQFAGPPSQPTIPDFDRAVQNLQTRIAETEEEWRIEATPPVVLDDWVQSVELLNEQFRKLEQEWSGSLTD